MSDILSQSEIDNLLKQLSDGDLDIDQIQGEDEKQVKNYDASLPVLLLSPIYLGEGVWEKEYDPEFNRVSVEVSRELKTEYGRLAKLYGYEFLAASDVAEPSSADREHMDAQGHRALADAVWKKLQVL